MGRTKSNYARRYCFTWNNYPTTAEEQIRAFHTKKNAIYTIVGRETGTNGTNHLQGYFHFKDRLAFTTLKNEFPSMHIEKAKGTAKQNKTYCSKELNFFEMGTCPNENGNASKESWKAILKSAEQGDWNYIKKNHPRVWIMFSEKLISQRIPNSVTLEEINNEWWYGETGTGKSRLAWNKYGTICYQKMLNKWWDGYECEPVVVIEEWSPKNEVTASSLKIWADRYPFTCQIKGGILRKIRPLKIIILSNYTLRDCFPDQRDADPIARRFKQFRFPDDIPVVTILADEFVAKLPIQEEQVESDNEETDLGEDLADTEHSDELELTEMSPDWLAQWPQPQPAMSRLDLWDQWAANEGARLNC